MVGIGFGMQASILAKLFTIVESGVITAPLWLAQNPSETAFPNNQTYVRTFILTLLATSFPNLTKMQVETVVMAMMAHATKLDQFKTNLRDFLIQLQVIISSTHSFFLFDR
jgi:hypothetical protein